MATEFAFSIVPSRDEGTKDTKTGHSQNESGPLIFRLPERGQHQHTEKNILRTENK